MSIQYNQHRNIRENKQNVLARNSSSAKKYEIFFVLFFGKLLFISLFDFITSKHADGQNLITMSEETEKKQSRVPPFNSATVTSRCRGGGAGRLQTEPRAGYTARACEARAALPPQSLTALAAAAVQPSGCPVCPAAPDADGAIVRAPTPHWDRTNRALLCAAHTLNAIKSIPCHCIAAVRALKEQADGHGRRAAHTLAARAPPGCGAFRVHGALALLLLVFRAHARALEGEHGDQQPCERSLQQRRGAGVSLPFLLPPRLPRPLLSPLTIAMQSPILDLWAFKSARRTHGLRESFWTDFRPLFLLAWPTDRS